MQWPGYRKPEEFIVDTGLIMVGGIAEAWGATIGGIKWDPGKDVRSIPYDGKSSEQVGLQRTLKYDAKLSGKVKRGGPEFIMDLEPGSSSDGSEGSSGNVVTLLDARTPWVEGDYLQDVYYIGRQEDEQIMYIHMPFAYVSKYSLQTKDNDEAEWDVELVPALGPDETNSNKIPFTYGFVAEE
jgi:hypothetical protein